jgi:zinc protease
MTVAMRKVDGVRLFHAEDPDLGYVVVEVVVEAGALLDPPGKEGLASLAASTLLRGTRNRSHQQVMDDVNDLGAGLDTTAQKETIAVVGDVMPRYLREWSDVVADVLANPAFPADEVERERSLVLEDLRNLRDDDGELAGHFFNRFLYRGHPLGRPTDGSLASVARLKAADCRAFHRAHVRRGNLIVLAAGAIDAAGADALVRRLVAGVPEGATPRATMPVPPRAEGLRALIVDKPGRTQSQVVLGHPSIAWRDPDLFPLLVGNTAFGGTFTSRLVREIREERGWSYGAGTGITAGRQMGTFSARFFPATRDTVPAIALTLDLMERAARDGLDAEEVEFAKDALANQFPFAIETVAKRAFERLVDEVYDRPAAFIGEYVARVRAQTPAEVNAALARWYRPREAAIVVVGTAHDLKDALAALPGVARVEVVPYTADELGA